MLWSGELQVACEEILNQNLKMRNVKDKRTKKTVSLPKTATKLN